MFTRIGGFTFVLISICFIISPQSLPAATTARVDFDGNQLSVRSEGIALGQLLSLVAEKTGVRFSCDNISAEKTVYANFENNSLADGIKRILSRLNHAMMYDGSGQISIVLVLDREMASLQNYRNQGELYAPQPENDIPENDISETSASEGEAEPLSVQAPGQGPGGDLPPPGGEPSLPSQSQSPPGAEKQNQLPPPLLDQDTESNPSSNAEEQAFSQPDDQNRVPDANVSSTPDVHNMSAGPNS